jgi:hypothetical protein
MPLYEAERHERLIGAAWDEQRARDAIDRIVADTHRSFDPDALWPIHPLDRSPERPPDSIKYIYHGAAGVIWALNYLNETGAVAVKRDYLPTVRQLIPLIRDDIDKRPEVRKYMGVETASYLLGEAGILLTAIQIGAFRRCRAPTLWPSRSEDRRPARDCVGRCGRDARGAFHVRAHQ